MYKEGLPSLRKNYSIYIYMEKGLDLGLCLSGVGRGEGEKKDLRSCNIYMSHFEERF